MVVLDFAFTPQATKPSKDTKEVTWYFDKNGLPTDRASANQEMKAVVPFDQPVRLNQEGAQLPNDSSPEYMTKRKAELDSVFETQPEYEPTLPPILSPQSAFSPLQFELYRQTLTPPSP